MGARVAIACGGTGGHIYPALALAGWIEAVSQGVETSFFVSKSERCRRMMSGYGGRVRYVRSRGMPSKASPVLVLFVLSLLRGVAAALVWLARERPDVVLGMGGYGSAPLVLAARLAGVPAVIHEQNLVLGRANAFLSRFASRAALTFPSVPDAFDDKKAVVTGTPVRPKIGQWAKAEARGRLGLRPDRFTVLVMGGSRGARFLNELAVGCAPLLASREIQWVHVSGEEDFRRVEGRYAEIGVPHSCVAFTDEIEVCYGAADMALCRAGAATIAELARCCLPALFIPYPYAVGRHQSLNAEYLAERGAAVVLEQEDASAERVAAAVEGLLEDGAKLSAMGEKFGSIFPRDASERLAAVVLDAARKRGYE